MSTVVRLLGPGSPEVELTSRQVVVRAPRLLVRALEVARRDVAGVVDLRVPGAARYGLCGPTPLRRPPASGALVGGKGRDPFTVPVVFRTPQDVPSSAARRLGIKAARGQAVALDLLELCPADPDELLDELAAAGVPSAPSVGALLARTIGVVDDPDEAADVSTLREAALERSNRRTQLLVALPVVALAVALVLVPGEARGQFVLLLAMWLGIAAVLLRSVRASGARAVDRLGPPPEDP